MPYLELAYWLRALLLASVAVCWADVLVRPGKLLAPVQAKLKARYRRATTPKDSYQGLELDDAWWWAPIWGCTPCVAGQWGFWAYLWLYPPLWLAHLRHLPSVPYSLLAHLGFTATTIILSLILSKWSQEH
jgi:hypothetical protein